MPTTSPCPKTRIRIRETRTSRCRIWGDIPSRKLGFVVCFLPSTSENRRSRLSIGPSFRFQDQGNQNQPVSDQGQAAPQMSM